MKRISYIRTLIQGEDATTAVEYAVMLALIIIIAFQSILLCGGAVSDFFNASATELDNAVNN